MNSQGLARTDIEIDDLSFLVSAGIKGISAVNVVTERGKPNTPLVVGSWLEYQRNFGGLLGDSLDPLICKRALDAGARLRVNRIVHYTDIADPATAAGVKATATLDVTLSTVHNTVVFTAQSEGKWGNGVTVTVAANKLDPATRDITESLTGYPELDKTVYGVSALPGATEKAAVNAQFKFITIGTIVVGIQPGAVTLATGASVNANIIATDFIGNSAAKTGIYAFNDFNDFVKIAAPGQAQSTIDMALAAYVDMRKDCMAVLRTPVGSDGTAVVAYREGTVVSDTHAAINTWRAVMTTGGLLVTEPLTNAPIELPETGDVLGAMCNKDNNYREWFTFAGPKRGLIKNALGVVENFGSPARTAEGDSVDIHGVCAVIDHPSFGPVIWGNSTLYKTAPNTSSLLQKAEVAELLIYLTRNLLPIVQSEIFDPNDIETWQAIYRKVKPFMDDIQTNRGIWKWLYQGDQDVTDVSKAVINTPDNIDQGKYLFYLWVAPKVGMKYQGVKVSVTNSSVDFSQAVGVTAPSV